MPYIKTNGFTRWKYIAVKMAANKIKLDPLPMFKPPSWSKDINPTPNIQPIIPSQCIYETLCFKIKKLIKAVNNGLQLTMKLLAPAETLFCP